MKDLKKEYIIRDFLLPGLCCLLVAAGFICRGVVLDLTPAVSSGELIRLRAGKATEEECRALARRLAGLCRIRLVEGLDPEPFFLWNDFIPGGGLELAAALRVSVDGGLLVLVKAAEGAADVVSWLGPDTVAVPTSLNSLPLPGGGGTALVLTDLSDQMAGAFCRRELCSILHFHRGAWRSLWRRELEAQAYWNKAWDTPPGRGWLRLAGVTDWRSETAAGMTTITATYRNSLAEAPGDGHLPEEDRFITRRESADRIEFHWDADLSLFVTGYARVLRDAKILARKGGDLTELAPLHAGTALAILADERTEPGALLNQQCLLQVWADGRIGLVRPEALELLAKRPADLTP